MSYDSRQANVQQVGAGAALTLTSTGVAAYTWNFLEPASIRQLAVKVTTLLSSSAPVVVQFLQRPTYGGATAQVVLGTVTLAATAAANALYVNNITPVKINAGDQVVANCSTAASTAGAAIFYIAAEYSPEVSKSESAVTVVTA